MNDVTGQIATLISGIFDEAVADPVVFYGLWIIGICGVGALLCQLALTVIWIVEFVVKGNGNRQRETNSNSKITTSHSHRLEIGDLITMNERTYGITECKSETTFTLRLIRWWHWPLIWIELLWRKVIRR